MLFIIFSFYMIRFFRCPSYLYMSLIFNHFSFLDYKFDLYLLYSFFFGNIHAGFLQNHYNFFIVPDPSHVTEIKIGTLQPMIPSLSLSAMGPTSSICVHIFVTYTNRVFSDTAVGLLAAIERVANRFSFKLQLLKVFGIRATTDILSNVNVTVSISGDISWLDYWEAKQRTLRVCYCSLEYAL